MTGPGAFSSTLRGAILLGSVGFFAGFVGPIIFMPGANQGPLLGIFVTGPLGFILGGIGGYVYWLAKGRYEENRGGPATALRHFTDDQLRDLTALMRYGSDRLQGEAANFLYYISRAHAHDAKIIERSAFRSVQRFLRELHAAREGLRSDDSIPLETRADLDAFAAKVELEALAWEWGSIPQGPMP